MIRNIIFHLYFGQNWPALKSHSL